MPTSLDHIHPGTPMGANLIADGATFRVWAPHAHTVHVLGDFNNRQRNDASLLIRNDRDFDPYEELHGLSVVHP